MFTLSGTWFPTQTAGNNGPAAAGVVVHSDAAEPVTLVAAQTRFLLAPKAPALAC